MMRVVKTRYVDARGQLNLNRTYVRYFREQGVPKKGDAKYRERKGKDSKSEV
jgi:hypothetical protein